MKLVRQTKTDKLCGQCCVAMVMDITLEHSIKLFSHIHGTRHKELSKIITNKRLGLNYTTEFIRYKKGLEFKSRLSILLVRPLADKDHRHWVVCNYGRILCPSDGRFNTIEKYLGTTWKITSVLFID